jgi:hypothetical protein
MTTHSAVLATPIGLTLTAKLFTLAAPDTVYKTAGSVTYRTNDTSEAVAAFTDVAADNYKMVYFSGARAVARGYRTFAGADGEVATETPQAAVLDPAILAQLQAIEDNTDASVGYLTTLVSRVTSTVKTMWDALTEMISGTTPNRQFTAKALELAPAGGSGGGPGDATLANQELILARLSEVTISVTGYAQLDPRGVLQLKRGHTATLTFTSDTNNIVSDLSASTTKVFFGVKDAAGRSWLSIEGTKLVNTGLQSVQFAVSAADAAAMINGEHFFDVVAVYGYDANTTPKYTSLEPFTSGRAKVTDLYVNI